MNKLNGFEKRVLETVKKFCLVEQGDKILIGLSGGKDSVVLLTTLKALSGVLNVQLCAFHLNHSIRGDEAVRDLDFSRSYCESLGVEFYTETLDVPKLAEETGEGLEAAARRARYECFDKYAKISGSNKIATAHTLSDNSETLVLSLLRNGTLSPIPVKRDNIIRPLIEVSTYDVVEYAKEKGLEFVNDSTNECEDYLRNFVRLSVLPLLREKESGIDNTLVKSGKIYSSYRSLAYLMSEEYFEKNQNPKSLDALVSLARNDGYSSVLFCVLERICADEGTLLTFERFEALSKALADRDVGAEFSLSNNTTVTIGYKELIFNCREDVFEDYSIRLNVGKNEIPNTPYTVWIEDEKEYVRRVSLNQQKINKIIKNNSVGRNIIENGAYARGKMNGDKFRCRGMTRSVKKHLIDSKIDRHMRGAFPVVCDNDGIVWVSGIGVADRVAPERNTDEEKLVISLEITATAER
jgi:tRNA(Ile)-lysidine synthase